MPLASMRIGRAFHYLQDQTELPDDSRHRFFRIMNADSRNFGQTVIGEIHDAAPDPRNSFWTYLRQKTGQYQAFGWDQINGEVETLEGEFAKRIKKALDTKTENDDTARQATYLIFDTYHVYFASLVALQNRIIRLYDEAASRFDTTPSPDTWEGTWQVTSAWESHAVKGVTWSFTVSMTADQWKVTTDKGNVFPAYVSGMHLHFTDTTGSTFRTVRYDFDRQGNVLTGRFSGLNKINESINGSYTGGRTR